MPDRASVDNRGYVVSIFTAPSAAAAVVRRDRVMARPGVGLDGDRYATGQGYWSADRRVSRDLTLIEAEVVDSVVADLSAPIDAGAFRRNIVTRGVRLNELVGVRFRIGPVIVLGTRLCEPCEYLARLVHAGLLPPLVHRGGLRADVLTAGEIAEGAHVHAG
jgi:MOSC domain-containing protein YiiM